MHVSEMAAIHLLRSHTPLLNSSKFKLLRPSLNSFIIYNQHDQNPNFSRHFRPIHSITPKSFKSVGNNWEEGPNNQHHQHNQHYQNQPWKRTRVGSNGEEGSENWARKGRLETCVGSNGEAGSNSFSVSKNEISENKMKFSGSLEHNAPVHPITLKSFPESPLVDVNGTFEEPISEPSARGWSNFCSPQSNPTNSTKAVGSSEEEELRIRVNLSLVSEKETSENMMESPPLPEQMVGHNAPVHPITPKSFPESPQSTSTNSIKGVGSRREEGSKIRVNLSPNLAESVVLTDSVAGGKKGKNKMCWVCVNCGHSEAQWWGTCKSCNKVGSLKQFLVSENETSEDEFPVWEAPEDKFSGWEASEDTVKSSFLPELMVGHNAPVHPITPKSFPESPLTDVNGASEEPISEPSARGFWSISRFPQSNPTNSITGVSSSEEKGSRIRMNMLENESSENMMESSSLPEQMVGHNAPVHPIIPKSCPESSQSTPTNSIKGVGSRGEEGSKIRVNLSPNVAKGVVLGDFLPGGKKGKSKMYWLCVDCGHSQTQWWGTCKSCNKFGTLKQFSVPENETFGSMMKASWLREQMIGQNKPVRLVDVNRGINHMEWRIRLSGLLGLEVNRVLGGGILPGSLILVGGDPGVGKSTLALQMAALVAVSGDVGGEAPVLYISGEESVEQIGNRADRLSIDTEELFLYSSTDIEDILEKVQVLSPRAVIVDSIQTMYLKGVTGSPGGMSQVKECTSALLRFAKKTNIPILLIGQVNKSGEIAGPRVLEHIVDVVLYMEGDKHSSHRLLRSVKNRFGSTDELGVVAMSESGLEPVSNSSEMFLSEEYLNSDHLVGLAIAVIIDGSRSFLIEVQALCVSGTGSTRHVNGVQLSRADMILSVLKKQAGLKLDDHSIFLNIISGGTLAETSGDLAVAAAICSSFLEFALPNDIAFIGEIGLGGELRMVPRIEKRVATLAKLGYKKCVVPALAVKALAAIKSEIKIVGCKNFKQVLDKVFSRED